MASVTNSVVTLFTQQLLFYSCARSVGVLTQGPCWSHSHTACCTHGGGVCVEFSHNQPTNQPTKPTNQPTNQPTNHRGPVKLTFHFLWVASVAFAEEEDEKAWIQKIDASLMRNA